MKGGDFTRDTFDKTKHFSRVLMQQGRVQLDADWNEQAAIMLHYLRALAADVIGTHGGTSDSFRIEEKLGDNTLLKDFAIHDGHYYVDGILCELEGKAVPISVQPNKKNVKVSIWVVDNIEFQEGQYVEVFDAAQPVPKLCQITTAKRETRILTLDAEAPDPTEGSALRLRRITTYMTQPGYPVPDDMQLSVGKYLVYLDVWERHITYLEDDGDISIREAALGGPDTGTRAKVVWQVKVRKSANPGCGDVKKLDRLSLPTLRARAKQTASPNEPCLIQPDARYRGAENQLYRVEIHTGGQVENGSLMPPPTFKWSRENASVIFPILTIASDTATTTVTLATLGRDDCLGLKTNDWVEIVDDTYTLQNRVEPLLQVSSIDRDTMTVRLTGRTNIAINTAPSNHPLLRRWDYKEKKDSDPKLYGKSLTLGEDKALQIVENDGEDTEHWLTLEENVQIQFPQPFDDQLPNQYRTGDYWLIPARTATGDVEWPTEKGTEGQGISSAMPPHGVEHHYAPLAVISVTAGGTVEMEGATCRHTITPPVD